MVKIGDMVNHFRVIATAEVTADNGRESWVVILGEYRRTLPNSADIMVEYVTGAMLPDGMSWDSGHYYGPAGTLAGDTHNRARARADFASRAGWGVPHESRMEGITTHYHGA